LIVVFLGGGIVHVKDNFRGAASVQLQVLRHMRAPPPTRRCALERPLCCVLVAQSNGHLLIDSTKDLHKDSIYVSNTCCMLAQSIPIKEIFPAYLLGWLTHALTLPARGHPSHAEACWEALRTSAKSLKTAQNVAQNRSKTLENGFEIASKLLGGVKAAASHENWERPGPIFQYLLGSGSAHPPIYFQYLLGFSAMHQYNTCTC
jgi:hypothetical protein